MAYDDDNRWDRQDRDRSYDAYRGGGDRGGYGYASRGGQRAYGGGYGGRGDGRRDEQGGGYAGRDYGQRDYGVAGYGQSRDMGRGGWSEQDRSRSGFAGGTDYYRGDRARARDYGNDGRDPYRQNRGTFDREPQDYGRPDDRGFLERAGDEVRSWFGDEEAERRREQDARRDEREAARDAGRDEHYRSWRDQQVAAFDRDYDEYRNENRTRFHNEFSTWRTERQGQRDLLTRVTEHLDVVGSDGEHVGTVDKVRGDRVILTKSDADAGGRHHSFPSRWLRSVEGGKATLTKTAAEAKRQWQDEESQGAMFGDAPGRGRTNGQQTAAEQGDARTDGGTNLDRSFSGTY